MKRVGVIGLGDMGIGMAENLLKSGFQVTGFDLSAERLDNFAKLGGMPAAHVTGVAQNADTIFIMVLNGKQVEQVVFGDEGLIHELTGGDTVIVTATITPEEVRSLVSRLAAQGIEMIDSPVSGGKSGADGGTLKLMTAAKKEVLEDNRAVLDAISAQIFHVGEEIGQGQTVKASLQALMGTCFAAVFEALVLGASAGVPGKTLYEVFSASAAWSPLFENCGKLALDRRFKGTGSHIGTMHKDMGITMQMSRDTGAAMFATAASYELFQAAKSMFPEDDNWTIVKFLEKICGTKVEW